MTTGEIDPQAFRRLDLEGPVNFRDLGGYETTDGRRVRKRHLFRSDALFRLTEADAEQVAAVTRRVRVFAGYAGWGGGQLEAELDEPSWVVEAADVEDVFGDNGDLWADVLRRKGGAFKLVATMPEDPSLN